MKRVLPLLSVVILGACSDHGVGPQSPSIASLDIVSGDYQTDTVGRELPDPLVVVVKDAAGQPLQGQVVNFVVTAGGGNVFAGANSTNADGIAKERWTLGTNTSDSQVVEVRAVDNTTGQPKVFARFQATAIPGAPATVAIQPDTVEIGALSDTSRLFATSYDQYGNLIPHQHVEWAAEDSAIAAVDSTGLIVALANGQTHAFVTNGAGRDTALVIVLQRAATLDVKPDAYDSASAITFVALGDTNRVSVTVSDPLGSPIDSVGVWWTSTDSIVASVTDSGEIVATASGTTWIVAVSAELRDSVFVVVSQRVASVEVTPAQDTLFALTDTTRFTADPRDANGVPIQGRQTTWTSSDESIASVDADGLVTAVANGSATITASVDGIAGSASVVVSQAVTSFAVRPSGAYMSAIGQTQVFSVRAVDAKGIAVVASEPITWTSLNPDVATVNAQTGEATGLRSGQVTIAATFDSVTGYALITIEDAAASPVMQLDSVPTPSGLGALYGVWGARDDAVWAVGDSLTVLFYDGSTWSRVMGSGSGSFTAVWGSSDTDVWAFGTQLYHFDGSSWHPYQGTQPGATDGIASMWGSAPDDIWIVCSNGVWHYDGVDWSLVSSPAQDLAAVWGRARDDVWFTGSTGSLSHFDGQSVRLVALYPTGGYVSSMRTGLAGVGPTELMATADSFGAGQLVEYDGTSWHVVAPRPTDYALANTWSIATSEVWIASAGLLRFDGGAGWTSFADPYRVYSTMTSRTAALTSVWGSGRGPVWAVGTVYEHDMIQDVELAPRAAIVRGTRN